MSYLSLGLLPSKPVRSQVVVKTAVVAPAPPAPKKTVLLKPVQTTTINHENTVVEVSPSDGVMVVSPSAPAPLISVDSTPVPVPTPTQPVVVTTTPADLPAPLPPTSAPLPPTSAPLPPTSVTDPGRNSSAPPEVMPDDGNLVLPGPYQVNPLPIVSGGGIPPIVWGGLGLLGLYLIVRK